MKTTLRTRTSRRWALGLLLSAATFAAAAQAELIGIGSGSVSFQAGGPAGLKIDGKGKGLTAKESGGTITVKAPLGGLKTGISLRDDHMKKALNASKHPHAILEVKRSSLKFPANNKTLKGSAKGSMTLNGVKKPISFNYKAERTGSDYHVQGLAKVDITKFKIEIPCYMGVCVDKDVQVKVKFKLRDK